MSSPCSPNWSIAALRRAERSATRSRCQETGGGGANFQTPLSAAKQVETSAKIARARSIDPPGRFLIIRLGSGASGNPAARFNAYRFLLSSITYRPMRKTTLIAPLLLLAPMLATAQPTEKVDLNAIHRIKEEALGRNSKVMDHVFYLTDANGPRLANSKGFRKAGDWAVERLKQYGLSNVHL